MNKLKITLLLLLLPISLFSYTFDFNFTGGNFSLNNYGSSDQSYKASPQLEGEIAFEDPLESSDLISYRLSAERSDITKIQYKGEIQIDTPYFNLSIGPVFSNDEVTFTQIAFGLNGTIRAELPGYFYVDFYGNMVPDNGNNGFSTNQNISTFGFYINKQSLMAALSLENYGYQLDTELRELTIYKFKVIAFNKSAPFRINTTLGYEKERLSFTSGNDIQINSFLWGLGGEANINPDMLLSLSFDSHLFGSSRGDIVINDIPYYRFSINTGLIWKL